MERLTEVGEASMSTSFYSQARAAFDYSLKNFLWKQAAFYAERLVAEKPCDETRYLLGLAYFHNQEISRAQFHLEDNKLPEARYLMAKCLFELKRYTQAEDALVSYSSHCLGILPSNVVNGAAGLFLLGQVQERLERREQAVECYKHCLELSPFMWEAYERWSWLVLGLPSPSKSSTSTANMAPAVFSDERFSQSIETISSANQAQPTMASPTARGDRPGLSAINSRSHNAQSRNELQQSPLGKGAGGRRDRRDSAAGRDNPLHGTARRQSSAADSAGGSELSLAGLLYKLGVALHALHSFDCHMTIAHLQAIPKRHYNTGYILDLVGLCHFESADYKKAEQAYLQAWRIEPRRIEGLQYYSTALWHMRKDIELGHLAQKCLQFDRLKPQVWCVVGNCFSLQKEHEVAIKFFKRAIQVDPSFAYAYTLCGHEFVSSEKFDKAVTMFQDALKLDPRHYNAWWGLGNIYHRQEEYDTAKYHFLKALEVNKNNTVLRCYLGMVLDSLKRPDLALDSFEMASQGEPQNAMAYFQKALVLISLNRNEEALEDLKKVRSLAPKEASVHFQLGKVYQKLQIDRKALFHFNIAMDLNRDSKDYHTIKTEIERLHVRGFRDPEPSDQLPSNNIGGAAPARRASGEMRQAPPDATRRVSGMASVGTGTTSPTSMQQHYGSSPPAARAEAQLQTPAAARGSVQPGGLWSAGGSSGGRGGGGGGGYPSGRGEAARAAPVPGTPPGNGSPSWRGTPAMTGSSTIHGPGRS
eukprot:TRINITY_DN36995_c0_g1_i1.p1 TRINITY_DN36995_c0_g1~~TRINITY_DN36995_c0_g1_i1.p1  ORF type:complete len:757 (+),score=108.29 TRINITY_DN36995_c0_g1_i1:75-2345(+)